MINLNIEAWACPKILHSRGFLFGFFLFAQKFLDDQASQIEDVDIMNNILSARSDCEQIYTSHSKARTLGRELVEFTKCLVSYLFHVVLLFSNVFPPMICLFHIYRITHELCKVMRRLGIKSYRKHRKYHTI